ncbi:hypothetical protein BDN71DRAFT_1427890 [Pleurotus eryngii]|uniref:Uncharacterized protein n=1 Tax=Pleurotus eryngii TaxID=5323 RepID=A0A9P6DB13_PLEER|nr:hypothetical protein BDN71DRAFT_1427890 [Pleurotus eryngii]
MTEHENRTNTENQGQGLLSQDQSTLDITIAEKCLTIIQNFHGGQCDKVSALIQLQKIIPHESDESASYLVALQFYIKMLNSFEQLCNAGSTASGGPDVRSAGTNRGELIKNEGAEANIAAQALATKHTHSPSEDDTSTLRRKLNTASLPWVINNELDPPALTNCNIKGSKASLTNSACCPQFPDTQWTNLLSGKSVNLNDVLINSIEILVNNVSKPAQTVNTHGKWVIAWDQAVITSLYVFPHRVEEL